MALNAALVMHQEWKCQHCISIAACSDTRTENIITLRNTLEYIMNIQAIYYNRDKEKLKNRSALIKVIIQITCNI